MLNFQKKNYKCSFSFLNSTSSDFSVGGVHIFRYIFPRLPILAWGVCTSAEAKKVTTASTPGSVVGSSIVVLRWDQQWTLNSTSSQTVPDWQGRQSQHPKLSRWILRGRIEWDWCSFRDTAPQYNRHDTRSGHVCGPIFNAKSDGANCRRNLFFQTSIYNPFPPDQS